MMRGVNCFAFVLIFLYLLSAFVSWEWNPADWEFKSRAAFCVIWVWGSICLWAGIHEWQEEGN